MNFTLFGYPKTGKTTLFNLLTGAKEGTESRETGKKEPHLRSCPVPDLRLDKIAAIYPEKKRIRASLDIIDLAGISYGEIKNSAYLGHLRRADGLVHVVRAFRDERIPHAGGLISPRDDILRMEEELVLADLVSVVSRLEKLEKDLKRTKDPEGEKEKDLLERIRLSLEEGKPVHRISLTASEEKAVRSFAFLSLKPLLHMINLDETDIRGLESPEGIPPAEDGGRNIMTFCGKIESEILELENSERKIFQAEYGIEELIPDKFYKECFKLLGVISFFTIGKEETRAWLIRENSPALKAAGAVHSDMERGFIRAEVISWDELCRLGSLQEAKDKGTVRLEGKEYIVRDGDIVTFRFFS